MDRKTHCSAKKFSWELYNAACNGDIRTVRKLLKSGKVDVNARGDSYGYFSLGGAAWGGHFRIVRCLVSHGARVDTADNNKWSALLFCCDAMHDNCESIVDFLLDHGCNVNQKSSVGRTALMLACEYWYVNFARKIIRRLVEHGADTGAIARDGRGCFTYPVHNVLRNGDADAQSALELLEKGRKFQERSF